MTILLSLENVHTCISYFTKDFLESSMGFVGVIQEPFIFLCMEYNFIVSTRSRFTVPVPFIIFMDMSRRLCQSHSH